MQHLPLALLKEGAFITSFITKRFQEQGLAPNVILNTNNLNTIQNLLNKNSVATFLYEGLLHSEEESIVAIPLPDDPEIQISLVWNKRHQQSRGLKALIKVLKSVASK